MRYEVSIDINAPAAHVYEVMADVEHWNNWTASIKDITRLDSGEFRAGSRARVRQPKAPPAVWTVDVIEPGHGFRWSSKSPGMTSVGDHWVVPTGEGTSRATLGFEQTGPGAGVAALLFGRLARRYVDMELAGLKKQSESARTP